ncbi:hypothetical protein GCM10009664_67890 [Kitasatospora gansuensis]
MAFLVSAPDYVHEMSTALQGAGVAVLVLLVARGANPRRAAAFRMEMRWLARAATRYLAMCATPLLLLLSAALLVPGSPDQMGFVELTAITTLWTAGPALIVLLWISRRAASGKHARTTVAVLINALPALLLLAGFLPIILFVTLQAVYAVLCMPGADASGHRLEPVPGFGNDTGAAPQ